MNHLMEQSGGESAEASPGGSAGPNEQMLWPVAAYLFGAPTATPCCSALSREHIAGPDGNNLVPCERIQPTADRSVRLLVAAGALVSQECRCLRPALHAQFGEDRADVVLNRLLG